jgi:hypothetical protein
MAAREMMEIDLYMLIVGVVAFDSERLVDVVAVEWVEIGLDGDTS